MKIRDKQILRNGDIYKVYCQKTGEYTILVSCAQCYQCKGINIEEMILKCEDII